MSSTYGEHAERAARAVAGLVANPAVPITPQHQQAVLQARDILLAALRERLRSQFAIYVAATDPAAQRPARLDLLRTTPLTELGYVLEHFPASQRNNGYRLLRRSLPQPTRPHNAGW
ncbi:MAG: hypothetical protein HZY75_05340 [Nocardioidaceae bacterium]|nr:MAG: hypothetical protein HZY75_05340 [Nocardioidaceae bacterium]